MTRRKNLFFIVELIRREIMQKAICEFLFFN